MMYKLILSCLLVLFLITHLQAQDEELTWPREIETK
jgi:hypothetical protein